MLREQESMEWLRARVRQYLGSLTPLAELGEGCGSGRAFFHNIPPYGMTLPEAESRSQSESLDLDSFVMGY